MGEIMTTIKHVAEYTGLSIGTISNFVNGKPTRKNNAEKIRAAIEKLDYIPNLAGKYLRKGKTKTIGILANKLESHFISRSCVVIEKMLSEHGYNVIFCTSNDDLELEKEKLTYLASSNVDAIILLPVSYIETDISSVSHIPTLLISTALENKMCNAVVFDDFESSYNATKYLYNCGHERIAILHGKKGNTPTTRIDGYKKALVECNLAFNEEYVSYGDFEDYKAEQETKRLFSIENPPTAVLVVSNEMLIGFLLGLKAKKKQVPEDVSYITFDYDNYYDINKSNKRETK